MPSETGDTAGFYKIAHSVATVLGGPAGGWRTPQRGVLGAVAAHWSLDRDEPTLASIPTGSGKTAVALAAPLVAAEPPRRVLVLVPSRTLREQLADAFRTQEQLHRIGVFPENFLATPHVTEVKGLISNWSDLAESDVVVALPNSISPAVYAPEREPPPRELFDMVIVDEAHHAPADTWRAVIDHFHTARFLLLTATPRRRDGRRIPGSLEYHYPLRRALDEGLYKPIEPVFLPAGNDRAACDAAIADKAISLLAEDRHHTSVLLVRATNLKRLREVGALYEARGAPLTLLHSQLSGGRQTEIVEGLRSGEVQRVGVVGMLGEGFDLPAVRLIAYHDKHRSLPATVQMIGRLARVDAAYPQPSHLITVNDGEIYPELKAAVKELYDEDSDWAAVLPRILDEEIESEQADREFLESLPSSTNEVDPAHLKPLKRAYVYEVPADWPADFLTAVPPGLALGARFGGGGTVLYSGADPERRLLVLVVRYVEIPKWSSDPALADVRYEFHAVLHRPPPRTNLPGIVFLSISRDGLREGMQQQLGLASEQLVGPERLGAYLDSLNRRSVSSVGVRNTNSSSRGRASYRNFMGSGVDRGLRDVDTARAALGHVMFQIETEDGSTANAGAAIEKSKLWLTRYGPLRELSKWADDTSKLLWNPRGVAQGPLLPRMDRGRRARNWPNASPLAAEFDPVLFGSGWTIVRRGVPIASLEDVELYVNDDPTGTLSDVTGPSTDSRIRMVVVGVDDQSGDPQLVWSGETDLDGAVTGDQPVTARRGLGTEMTLAELLTLHPPSLYFLDGTTVVGPVIYDRRSLQPFDIRALRVDDWTRIDITAETRRTAVARNRGERSVHQRVEEVLLAQPRIGAHRWILLNDGSGEFADHIVIEELPSGEIALGLWHSKGSGSSTPAVRIKDFQVVVAQALRSRGLFFSTAFWADLAERLAHRARPYADIVDGSDDADLLKQRLGLDPQTTVTPWTRSFPSVRGTIAVVQPGLSVSAFQRELNTEPIPHGANALNQLFSVLTDAAISDGADLYWLVSR
jgi:superfamily II DNA or RNA helicase